MAFTFRETQIVKGMIARGDKQHDIASYFGVNGGRVAEVSGGEGDYPTAQPLPPEKLPPAGPYVGAKSVFEISEILSAAIDLIEGAGNESEESQVAIQALSKAKEKIG